MNLNDLEKVIELKSKLKNISDAIQKVNDQNYKIDVVVDQFGSFPFYKEDGIKILRSIKSEYEAELSSLGVTLPPIKAMKEESEYVRTFREEDKKV